MNGSDFLTSREAARILDVKPTTLYAYVSRGLVRSVPGPAGRPRRYLRADVERLAARRDARKGHAAVAAGALRWGEPVLDSAITEITPTGHYYRGHDAVGLARAGRRFESVAELLWTGTLPASEQPWPGPVPRIPAGVLAALPAGAPPMAALSLVVPALAARDPDRTGAGPDRELVRARGLILAMARAAGPQRRAAAGAVHVSEALATGFGAPSRGAARSRAIEAIDVALIAIADHELNVSAFAARVVASTGAHLHAAVAAALDALSGPLHGGACDRVEALVDECGQPRRARAVVRARLARGDAVPGFGHPFYPDGDPRALLVLERARALGDTRLLDAVIRAMADAGHGPPAVNLALVALARALALPPGAAITLFAVGRAAGWIAHALEQREAGFLLRPRARFVGVARNNADSATSRNPVARRVVKGNAPK